MAGFDLDRFVAAQDGHLRPGARRAAGRGASKATGCGSSFPSSPGSAAARPRVFYAIASAAEARAYLAHPLLGARLGECTAAVLAHREPERGGDLRRRSTR